MRGTRLVLLSLAAGLAAGLILTLVTYLVAKYGPQGDGWSLRGNGALIVPFGLGPCFLAAGWTALVARHRARERWLWFGVGAGLVGLALVLASLLLLLGGSQALSLSSALSFAPLLWMIVAPVAAALQRKRGQPAGSFALHVGAGAAFAFATVAAFYLSALVLPPG